MRAYDTLQDTLSVFGVRWVAPYYVSSGNPISVFPEMAFRMDYYAFVLCVEGQVNIEIDGRNYLVQKDGFLISAPYTIVRFKNVSKDFILKLLFFEKNFILKNISNPFIIEKYQLFPYGTYNIVAASPAQAVELESLLDYLKKKAALQGIYTEEIVRTIIFNLLLEIAEIIGKGKCGIEKDHERTRDLFLKFNRLVQKNIQENRDIEYYAQQLCISNKYLIKIVKKASGKTPHQIIDEALLKEAFVLLGKPDRTISEIAYLLHFNSASAFSRFFKKYAFLTPSQYRTREHIAV